VDSDLLIRHLRGQPAAVARLQALQASEVLACSVVTAFEALRGATPQQLAATEAFISSFVQLPVTEAISQEAAAEYRLFRSQNVTLSMADLLIGCTARLHNIPLLTGNAAHFPMAGLVLLGP